MSRKITINSFLVFEPEKKRITGRGQTAVISASASLCLELLIENAGHLVTHQQFYEYVWRRFGTEPSSASLYHNISLLRRAFLKAGLREDIIRTMPRKGFLLSPQTTIKKKIHEHSVSALNTEEGYDIVSTSGDEISDENDNEPPLKMKHEKKQIHGNIRNHLLKLIKINFISLPYISKKQNHFFSVFSFMALLFYFFYFSTKNNDNDLFIYSLKYKECKIFNNSNAWLSQEEIKKEVDKINITCNDHPYVYLTAYKNSDILSYFNCEHPLSDNVSKNCRSYYYIKGENND